MDGPDLVFSNKQIPSNKLIDLLKKWKFLINRPSLDASYFEFAALVGEERRRDDGDVLLQDFDRFLHRLGLLTQIDPCFSLCFVSQQEWANSRGLGGRASGIRG